MCKSANYSTPNEFTCTNNALLRTSREKGQQIHFKVPLLSKDIQKADKDEFVQVKIRPAMDIGFSIQLC